MYDLRRISKLRMLWSQHEAFAAMFLRAARDRFVAPVTSDRGMNAFLDNVVARLIVRPADLLSLCQMLNDETLSREFMRFYMRHELADHDVIFALVESPAVVDQLPDDPAWKEVAVLLYGSAKLREANGRKLSIHELAPLGVDVARSTVRSLVGSTFDSGLLADQDSDRLLSIFPNDAYFAAKLAR